VQELRVHARAGFPISGFHEPRQAAIALLLEEQRAMLRATEIA